MDTHFNNDAKEQIRLRANIVAIVGRHVNLKARGQVMVGLCPFHKEKTPSFQVNPAKNMFYCFGCGKGGDVFKFVQEIEGVDFVEALQILAEETGVQLTSGRRGGSGQAGGGYDGYGVDGRYDGYEGWYDEYGDIAPPQGASSQGSSPQTPPSRSSKPQLLAIHDAAAKFFYECMKDNPKAVDYFKSRGLEGKTVKEFRLGYAPDGWTGLCDYLASKNITRAQVIECGLAVSKDSGAYYDRFRERVMFPLCDLNGRVVAFAGRGLNADIQPKYLNSPETALYQKSRILYGLHTARQGIRERGYVLIVEGYMDCLTLYQAGITNVAAVSGTAFTTDHAHLIKRFAQRVIFVFDSDRAGLAAAQRAALVLAPFGLQASILTLPAGDDPDTFVSREGAGAFMELLSSAKNSADFLIDKLVSEHNDTPQGKSKIVEELAPYAQALTDPIVLDDFTDRLSRRLRVNRQHVADRFKRRAVFADDSATYQNISPKTTGLGALEESFLRLLMTNPELIFNARQYISPEIFTDTLSANVYSIILDSYIQRGNLDGLLDVVSGDSNMTRLIAMLLVKPAVMEDIQAEFVQKIMLLRRKYIKARMADLREELRGCPEEEKGRLLEELVGYGEQLKELDLSE